MVDWSTVLARLTVATGFWVATVARSGRPHVVPVWGAFVDDDLYLTIGAPDTAKVRHLEANPGIAVHLDGAEDAVIVLGTAIATAADRALGTVIAGAFSAKYPGYAPEPTEWETGGLVRIEPQTVLAWHDMATATRWRFRVESRPERA